MFHDRKEKINIGAVILAGGKSSRMGGFDKALIELEGSTYLERIAAELSFFSERILSGSSPKLAEKIGFKHVPDIIPEKGPMGGIYSALISCESSALFFAACDMPYFRGDLAKFLESHFTNAYDCIIFRDTFGRIQPLCGIYNKSCISTIESLLNEDSLKMSELVEKLNAKIIQAPEDRFSIDLFKNINRKEDIPE